MRNFDEFKASLEADSRLSPLTIGRLGDLPGTLLDQPKAAADHCLQHFGFAGLGGRWRSIDRQTAVVELTAQLNRSLAYGVEMLPETDAAATAAAFLCFAPMPDAAFLTNSWPGENGSFGWDSVSASTFDVCFVAIGGGAVAFIVLEDED